MKFRNILAAVLAFIMIFALCACGNAQTSTDQSSNATENTTGGGSTSALAGTYNVTLWVAENAVELTKTQIENFNKTNTDGITIVATVEPVSEADAATQMITDVEAGADIFCFAQDQFARLVQAGALAKLGTGAQNTVKTNNVATAVSAVTSGDSLYAYPLTADNGYFMYYDKSVISDSDVDSLEALIAACETAGKYFAFEMNTSAWYIASFFFGTGCVSEWATDDDGAFVSVHDTFNSANGLIAVKGMKKLVDSPYHLSSSSGSQFSNGAAIVVSGTWDYETVKSILGDNMGVTDLPSFTVDGTSYHLGSFSGCKLMGVKPQTDATRQAVLHRLAQYLTNYDCQMERFNELSWGPSNTEAQKSEAVQSNPGLVALNAQNEYATIQGQIHGSWWDIAKVIADDVKAATDDAGLQTALDNYRAKMEALFSMSDEEKNAWTVIGDIGGDTWTTDITMTEKSSGVWETEEVALEAGNEFKCRQGKSWDNALPSSNYVVETGGVYKIRLEVSSGTITLIPAN